MIRSRVTLPALVLGVALHGLGACLDGAAKSSSEVVPVSYLVPAAAEGPEAAVSQLVDEINLVTGAPTRTHEQRVELLRHIRERIEAVLAEAPQSAGAL